MAYEYDKGVDGTPGSDAKQYNIAQVKVGDIVDDARWTQLINAVKQERTRRGLPAASITNAVQGQLVTTNNYNTIRNAISSFASGTSTVNTNTLISASGLNTLIQKLNSAGNACLCNCDYCTCNCNQCTCNCNHSCTCDCNYHFILESING